MADNEKLIEEILELLHPDPWAVAEARDNARHAEREEE
jgi:hypothetical protein